MILKHQGNVLKAFTGSIYVNDFNMFNRVYRVYIQADAPYRAHKDNLNLFFVKSSNGTMVPVNALGSTQYTTGPGTINRFNMYYAITVNGEAAHGYSSGQAMDLLESIAREHLPDNIGIEWSGLSYQEKKEGGQTGVVLGLALLFVFLFLAAQYESWSIPIAVLLSLPIAIAGAYLGVWVLGYEANVYFLIGLVMLVGLVAKNAILIVEFAKEEVEKGKPLEEAAVTAAHLRFRPIVMTSLAFILGMLPLVFATGPGSASRQDIGTGVFFGMIVAITAGIVFVPFFFVQIYKLREKMSGKRKKNKSSGAAAAIAALIVAGGLGVSCSPAKHCAAPQLDLPETFVASVQTDTLTWADVEWWKIYPDTTLHSLIKQALEYNKDMLAAAERLREMEYRYKIQRSQLWPSISASVYGENEYTNYSGKEPANDPVASVLGSFSWEIDLWGNLRWASREKLAEYFASVEAQRALKISLIAEVANAYFDLQALDNELLIVRRTLETRDEGVQKARIRLDGGLTSDIPYQQALVERATTAALVPELEREVAMKESELAFLTGSYPRHIERSRIPLELSYRKEIPVGVPSQLLTRRPDLRQAEQELRAAEAAVGVAQAERFPSFTITFDGGTETNTLANIIKAPYYYLLGNFVAPVFEFGKRRANFKAAIAEYNQARLNYEKDVLQAFKEVYDAVVSYNSAVENTSLKFDLQEASKQYVALANLQYINGAISYMDVLDAQRAYFSSQVELSNAIMQEYKVLVDLYKALGGGWNAAEETSEETPE